MGDLLYIFGFIFLVVLIGFVILFIAFYITLKGQQSWEIMKTGLGRDILGMMTNREPVFVWAKYNYMAPKRVQVEYFDHNTWLDSRYVIYHDRHMQLCQIKMPCWLAERLLDYSIERPGFEGHYNILKSGVETWNVWRRQFPEILPQLQGCDLSELDLSNINLSGTNLDKTDLRDTILRNADLTNVSGLLPEQVAVINTLFSAAIDEPLRAAIAYRFPHLLAVPEDDDDDVPVEEDFLFR